MKLVEYRVENFKSIELGQFEISENGVLIGKNNSGKSNIIKSLSKFKEILLSQEIRDHDRPARDWFEKCVIGKDTSKDIYWELTFELSNSERNNIESQIKERGEKYETFVNEWQDDDWLTLCKVQMTAENQSQIDIKYMSYFDGEYMDMQDLQSGRKTVYFNGRNVNVQIKTDNIMDKIQKSVDNWEFVNPIREPDDMMDSIPSYKLDGRGTELIQVLHYLSVNKQNLFRDIQNSFLDIMQGVTDMKVQFDEDTDERNKITVMIEEEPFNSKFKSSEISSGSKEILVLLTKVHMSRETTDLLAIEEPELHLHPGAEKKVFDTLQKQSMNNEVQLIISTHSSVFVNRVPVEDIVRIERDGTTKMRGVSADDINRELKDLGYDQSALLQAEAVILVEGRSDRLILGNICETFGVNLNDLGIEIIELEGESNAKSHSRSLVKIFMSFDISYLYVVDSHDNDPHEEMMEYIDTINRDESWWHTIPSRFHVWTKYSIESYLLDPKGIATIFDTDLETMEELISEARSNAEVNSKKGEEILEYIFHSQSNQLKRTENAYLKGEHGLQLANVIHKEDYPEEVGELIGKIENLPEKPPSLDIEN